MTERVALAAAGPLALPDATWHATRSAARQVSSALRGIGLRRAAWTAGIGVAAAAVFLLQNAVMFLCDAESRPPGVVVMQQCAVALVAGGIVALLLRVALAIAEHGDGGQPRGWLRYVVATTVAAAMATAAVHALPRGVPVQALVSWYGLETPLAIDSFVFVNVLLFGGIAVMVCVRLRCARWRKAVVERAELERIAASSELMRSRLAASQAQVEPAFLFDALRDIEARYDRDVVAGERAIDALIAYLRAALPQLRGEDSTLAHEAALVEAYLRIVQARMGSRLAFEVDVPLTLGARPFPPMLLMPVVEHAIAHNLEPVPRGGTLAVRATLDAQCLRVTVSDDGLAPSMREAHRLAALRERIAAWPGGRASLTFAALKPWGTAVVLEVAEA